jgi:hypothetical protein
MANKLLLNGSNSVNYFIHGQVLSVEFEFTSAWFVSIYYNEVPISDRFRARPFWFWKRRFWYLKKGEFNAHMNVKHPYLRITTWSPFPKRVWINLKVNKIIVNQTMPILKLNKIKPIGIPQLNLYTKSISLVSSMHLNPSYKIFSPSIKSKGLLLTHSLNDFKINHSDNNKI